MRAACFEVSLFALLKRGNDALGNPSACFGGELILAQALRFPKPLDVLSECHA